MHLIVIRCRVLRDKHFMSYSILTDFIAFRQIISYTSRSVNVYDLRLVYCTLNSFYLYK